jgi:hypothetical protein
MQSNHLTDLQKSIIGYIAGFVVRKLKEKLVCYECLMALQTNDLDIAVFPHLRLIQSKQRGGLVLPSTPVVQLIELCEKTFRQIVCQEEKQISSQKGIKKMMLRVVSQTDVEFPTLDAHDLETNKPELDLHSTQLKKAVCETYLRVRLLTYGQKYFTDVIQRQNIGKRQKAEQNMHIH